MTCSIFTFIISLIDAACYCQNFTLPLWGDNIPNYQKTDEVERIDSTNIVRLSLVQNPIIPVEALSSRPDFMILLYPVITFSRPFMHKGSRNALLGENPDSALKPGPIIVLIG